MRQALARQDISAVYRLLRDTGVSQRRIADAVGQSPSEVCEIIAGREVSSYRVLARIADGLGIPRTYLGLADVPQYRGEEVGEEDEAVKRRRFLANAAAIIVGEAVLGDPVAAATPDFEFVAPSRVGMPDVHRLRTATTALRQLDYQLGGGVSRTAAVAQARASEMLFGASMPDEVRRELHLAVADLHSVVGLASFDCLLPDQARHHYLRAIEHAKQADDPALSAFLLCRMGHIYLSGGEPDAALKLFHLAELPATDSRFGAIGFVTACYQARAYSEMGIAGHALDLTSRSEDNFAQHAGREVPQWLEFFRKWGADSVRGHVCFALSGTEPKHASMALEAMRSTVNVHKPGFERDNLMDLASLATLHLRAGNVDHGLRIAATTVTRAEQVDSKRLNQWLQVLGTEARGHGADGKELAVAVGRLA